MRSIEKAGPILQNSRTLLQGKRVIVCRTGSIMNAWASYSSM
jgi:hypothetical protein